MTVRPRGMSTRGSSTGVEERWLAEQNERFETKIGCVVSITAALADRPIAGVNGSISMITKGGLNSATQNLAIEYAKDGVRFNAVAPGEVDTPMHQNDPTDSTLQLAMRKATVKDIVDAVLYLVQADHAERYST
jgi:NAD(P)-dependent dehydrogenase (short-subunit alcohol dehydrogenase family)